MPDKTQRVRDPIHNLIVFEGGKPLDELAWRLLNTPPFQRLRRVKQLGFSELVYPGATHTRFSHCVGVFANARTLIEVVKRKMGGIEEFKAAVAVVAALLHDLGHGPFSHTFEGVEKQRHAPNKPKKHEYWTRDILEQDKSVRQLLDSFDPSLAPEVGKMLTRKDPENIYDSIVSSQFDADRLDYLPRDRYMSGIGGGQFDSMWLMDCLEVGDITVGLEGEDKDFVTVPSLYLSEKGLQAAESYVLARFYLYSQVYLHKTTRSAEKMLSALLTKVSTMLAEGDVKATGLDSGHPLVRFFLAPTPTVEEYLALDDVILWSALGLMTHAPDVGIAELSQRLLDRKLYKCFDVGARSKAYHGNSVITFRKKLRESGLLGTSVLEDTAKLTPYGIHDYDDKSALQKVLVAKRGTGKPEDLADLSPMVKAVAPEQIYRTYAVDQKALSSIEEIWRETIK